MNRERCPECGRPDPPPLKTCARAACGRTFRVPEGGCRSDALYCSGKCAAAQAQQAFRDRRKAGR
jgi:hypothetical protein